MSAGTGDCEAARAGFLGQPSNAMSSLALVAVGAWIAWRGRRAPSMRLEAGLFGLAVALVGVGSLLLHGPHPAWGPWFHDVAIATGLAMSVAVDLVLLGTRRRDALVGVGVVTVLAASTLAAWPDAQRPLYAVLGGAFGSAEVACLRRGLHRTGPWIGAAALFALGTAAFWAGKDGSPWCRPDSLVQWHAAWHVLQAAALATWSVAAFPAPASSPVSLRS
ncbi:MAG: hypothetical protein ACM3OO_08785 [Planctomycetaceae bacterium]